MGDRRTYRGITDWKATCLKLEQQLDECIGAIENIFGGGGPEIVPDWIMEEIERRENW